MTLASRFGKNSAFLRSSTPLSDEQIRAVAPSIFADDKHESRSDRYTYIPTIQVLDGLRKEGFSPFMVCRTRVRDEGKHEHAKHMIRLRHADQIEGTEAHEIILLNSHDGSSSYQMLSGVFRFVCQNGMVCGETHSDIRVPHKGNIVDNVIEGACRVLDDFEQIGSQMDGMKSVVLSTAEQEAFARSALMLKYDEQTPPPVTEGQLLRARRTADASNDLWSTFNRVQENMIRGGLRGRSTTGRAVSTRPVQGIDQNVKLNRALWALGEAMLKLKAGI